MSSRILLPVVFLACVSAVHGLVRPGDDLRRMIEELGEPSGQIQRGETTVYSYPDGAIHARDGKVVSVSEGFFGSPDVIQKGNGDVSAVRLGGEPVAMEAAGPSTEEGKTAESVWLEDPSAAREQASSAGKPLLMFFTGSDWCVWCQRLEREVLKQPAFIEFARSEIVALKVDFPQRNPLPAEQRERNQQLAEAWGVEGFPTLVLLNPEGESLGRTGYQGIEAEAYVGHLREIIESGPESMGSGRVSGTVRRFLGDDVADSIEQLGFLDGVGGRAVQLSIQGVLLTILVIYVLRRLLKR